MIHIPEKEFQEILTIFQSLQVLVDAQNLELSMKSILRDTLSVMMKKQHQAFDVCKELTKRNVPSSFQDFQKIMFEASEMYSLLIRPPLPLASLRTLQELHECMDSLLSQWIEDMLELWKD